MGVGRQTASHFRHRFVPCRNKSGLRAPKCGNARSDPTRPAIRSGGHAIHSARCPEVTRPRALCTRVGRVGVLCAVLLVTAGSTRPAIANPTKVRLVVNRSTALVDQRVDVRLSGLRAKQRVRLSAATRDAAGRTWRSQLMFRATRGGVVHTRSNMKLVDAAAKGSRRHPTLAAAWPDRRADRRED